MVNLRDEDIFHYCMITLMFILSAQIIIKLMTFLFGQLAFVIPVNITNAVTYFLSYLGYLGYILPVNTLMQAVGVYLTFLGVWYTLRIIQWMLQILPFVGPAFSNLPRLQIPEFHMGSGTLYDDSDLNAFRYARHPGHKNNLRSWWNFR